MTRDNDPAARAAGDDDDALSWAGEDDPTLSSHSDAASSSLAPGWKVVGEPGSVVGDPAGSEAALADDALGGTSTESHSGPREAVTTTDAAAASSTALIVLGILGGIFLLYTVGWAVAAGRVASSATDIVGSFMFTLGIWLAVAAPALWFAMTLWLTRSTSRWRIVWLIVGVVVLVPVPFIAGVGGGL